MSRDPRFDVLLGTDGTVRVTCIHTGDEHAVAADALVLGTSRLPNE